MRAQNRVGLESRLRALTLLLTCVLGLALISAARSGVAHKHVAHRVVAVASADVAKLLHHSDSPAALPPAAPGTARIAGSLAFANSSRAASSHTADPPRVRGPPGQALA